MNESTLAEVKLSMLGHSDFFARARHNLFARHRALILNVSGAGLAFMPIVYVTFGYAIEGSNDCELPGDCSTFQSGVARVHRCVREFLCCFPSFHSSVHPYSLICCTEEMLCCAQLLKLQWSGPKWPISPLNELQHMQWSKVAKLRP